MLWSEASPMGDIRLMNLGK